MGFFFLIITWFALGKYMFPAKRVLGGSIQYVPIFLSLTGKLWLVALKGSCFQLELSVFSYRHEFVVQSMCICSPFQNDSKILSCSRKANATQLLPKKETTSSTQQNWVFLATISYLSLWQQKQILWTRRQESFELCLWWRHQVFYAKIRWSWYNDLFLTLTKRAKTEC